MKSIIKSIEGSWLNYPYVLDLAIQLHVFGILMMMDHRTLPLYFHMNQWAQPHRSATEMLPLSIGT